MKLQFISNHKLTWTYYHMEKVEYWDDKTSFITHGYYVTPIGTVVITVTQWKTYDQPSGAYTVKKTTEFETLHIGRWIRAILPVNGLSDRNIKIYATKFLKQILKTK